MRNSKTAEVIEKFAVKRRNAEIESDKRCVEIHSVIPETEKIDRELRATALNILTISMSGTDIEEKMASLEKRNGELRERRAALLESAGYPADYTDIHFECPICSDTGFVGARVCGCLRKEIALAALEDSGIGHLAKTQSFENFDFKYYSGDALEHVKKNYDALKGFAENFDREHPDNYILMGPTGLGKTHLSTSVAKVVIDRGYKVVYDTIDGIISDFKAERFKDTMTEDEIRERYYDCDLLIIDDLGCEISNQFSVSCVYNLINTRINGNKSTIINTNLKYEELRAAYADRITSRLFGEFKPLIFMGRDIRQQKIDS